MLSLATGHEHSIYSVIHGLCWLLRIVGDLKAMFGLPSPIFGSRATRATGSRTNRWGGSRSQYSEYGGTASV